MSDGGKGSAPRKQQDQEAYADGWDRIFSKNPKQQAHERYMKLSQEVDSMNDKDDKQQNQ